MLVHDREFCEGREAKKIGETTSTNPYELDSPEWRRWWSGWMVERVAQQSPEEI